MTYADGFAYGFVSGCVVGLFGCLLLVAWYYSHKEDDR